MMFLYLGGLAKGRGIEVILEAFSHPKVSHHVLFMGAGPLSESVSQAAAKCSRIHHRAPVPPSEVLAYAAGADAGLSLIEDSCLSYRYCLPNKLFEYLLAGVPVLASNLPDQARLIADYKAGWTITPNAEQLVAKLFAIDVQEARELRESLPSRVRYLRWEDEVKPILEIYGALLKNGHSAWRYST